MKTKVGYRVLVGSLVLNGLVIGSVLAGDHQGIGDRKSRPERMTDYRTIRHDQGKGDPNPMRERLIERRKMMHNRSDEHRNLLRKRMVERRKMMHQWDMKHPRKMDSQRGGGYRGDIPASMRAQERWHRMKSGVER